MATYPTAVKAFSTRNTGDTIQAAHINDLQDEVTAIEDALLNGLAHLLDVSAFGTHTFSAAGTGGQIVQVRNTAAGTGNYAALVLGNDASATAFGLFGYSSTYTTSGPSVANGVQLYSGAAGGISIAAQHASGGVRVYAGGVTLRSRWLATGGFEHTNAFSLSGILAPAQFTANVDDWAPTDFENTFWFRVNADAPRNLTGISGASGGRLIALSNQGAFTITLKHETTSTAANRLQCPGGLDYALTSASSVMLYYDSSAGRWYVLG